MTTYGQSTIHSKLAKFEKTNQNVTSGRLVKGINSQFRSVRTKRQSYSQSQIIKQIEILPKSKLNVKRKMKNQRVIPSLNKKQTIVLMESSTFPAIYFKKTALRNVLKQFSFPQNCQQLPAEDSRTTLLYQIVSNLFNEISFYIFNIITCQNIENNSYYLFFSDCQTLPFTKCCNAPVFIELQENGSGKMLCNSTNCKYPNLAEFLINFDDGYKLWPHIPYFSEASSKDRELKQKISKLIINGKYKKRSLVGMVQDTSKEIVDLFYQSKKANKRQDQQNIHNENTFMTGAGIAQAQNYCSHPLKSLNNHQIDDPEEKQVEELLKEQDHNLDTLKMKLKYITKRQTDISKRLSKSIVEESKVFHNNFDIIRKIDEQMFKNRNSKISSKITFPQLMSQIQRIQKKQEKQ